MYPMSRMLDRIEVVSRHNLARIDVDGDRSCSLILLWHKLVQGLIRLRCLVLRLLEMKWWYWKMWRILSLMKMPALARSMMTLKRKD